MRIDWRHRSRRPDSRRHDEDQQENGGKAGEPPAHPLGGCDPDDAFCRSGSSAGRCAATTRRRFILQLSCAGAFQQ